MHYLRMYCRKGIVKRSSSAVSSLRYFAAFNNKGKLTGKILAQYGPQHQAKRQIVSTIIRFIPRMVTIPRIILIGGGVGAATKYEQWKEGLPDTSWIKGLFPDSDNARKNMNKYWTDFRQQIDKLSLPDKSWVPPSVTNVTESGRQKLKEILSAPSIFTRNHSEVLIGGQGQFTSQANEKENQDEKSVNSKKAPTNSLSMSANSTSGGHGGTQTRDVQDELLHIQNQYQHELDRLEKENRELRKQLLLRRDSTSSAAVKSSAGRSMRQSPIDMYSDILDTLSTYDTSYNAMDHLPRVVVVGDQSSGKTSVLEMIAQARIFPRGHGEMMTRSPVMVTLSEGPFHVAQFKDSNKEYDLSNERDLSALRKEIESRMRRSVQSGKTISYDVISLSVKGPGLHRMVLVDLPGIISTVTTGMSSDTKSSIQSLCKKYMENPNAIILCIQDGSIDAERSNVTDLVSSIDKEGKRTIFVLTKVDLAQSNLHSPDRIKQILDGQLFPMKALGYFAVVTGKGNNEDSIASIKQYEEEFFKNSTLAKEGILKPPQMTTRNLSMAVSTTFWKMVHESIQQQSDEFKATRYNLETEWKNTYPGIRELDRVEVFEKARYEILDQLITLSQVESSEWEKILSETLWDKMSPSLFETIYLPAWSMKDEGSFNTHIDIKLKSWVDKSLPITSVDVGRQTLVDKFTKLVSDNLQGSSDQSITGQFKLAVLEEVFSRHKWDTKAEDSLRVLQQICLDNRNIPSKLHWTDTIDFMVKYLEQMSHNAEQNLCDKVGPGTIKQWTSWKYRTDVQNITDQVKNELEPFLLDSNRQSRRIHLTRDELQTVRSNVIRRNTSINHSQLTDELINDTWHHVYRKHFLSNALTRVKMCKKAYNFYANGQPSQDCGLDCKDVWLFWRIQNMLKTTSSTLRQQIRDHEARRLERIMREVLEEFSDDPDQLIKLINGDRIKLAEELRKVRHIQDKLEEFIKCLNKEKS